MSATSNATPSVTITLPTSSAAASAASRAVTSSYNAGLAYCALGVLAFSLTFPATRAAVPELGAALLSAGRGVIAALLAISVLLWRKDAWPERAALPQLFAVALGGVIGFPAFSALALRSVPSHHAALVAGLVPLFTALFATWLGGERPPLLFWVSAVTGLSLVLGFACFVHPTPLSINDVWLVLAAACAACSYAQGARVARRMGGFRVISWALVLALPVTAPATLVTLCFTGFPHASLHAWLGLAYVSAISMFLAFFVWYRGLAATSVAQGGQIQLLQPALSVLWSALLLGEGVSHWTLVELGLIACLLLGSRRIRVARVAS